MKAFSVVGLLALCLLSPSVMAQSLTTATPFRIQNNGTSVAQRNKLNFVNGGCVDNSSSKSTDCTIGGGGVTADSPLTGNGTSGSHLACPMCVVASQSTYTLTSSVASNNVGFTFTQSNTQNGQFSVLFKDVTTTWLEFGYQGNVSGAAIFDATTGTGVQLSSSGVKFSGPAILCAGNGSCTVGSGANFVGGMFNSGVNGGKYNTQSGTSYVVQATDWYVGLSNTAARSVTLCAASAFYPGQMLIVNDEANTALSANITITRAGSDTIDGGTSKTINTNSGDLAFISDGVSKWFVIAKGL